MEPSAKRSKTSGGEKKQKYDERQPLSMGIMLMTTSAEPMVRNEWFDLMERDIQAQLEQVRLDQKTANVEFGDLKVRVRLLRYTNNGNPIDRGNAKTFVPFADMANPLCLVCNFFADWVTNGRNSPFKKKKPIKATAAAAGAESKNVAVVKFPVEAPDQGDVDPGPFHAMIFSYRCSRLDWFSGVLKPSQDIRIWWEASEGFNESFLHQARCDARIFNKQKWIEQGRPVYPVLDEILHCLAGRPQDITTWFAYKMLLSMQGYCAMKAALASYPPKVATYGGRCDAVNWMPPELLEAKLGDNSTPFLFFRLVQASFAGWVGMRNRSLVIEGAANDVTGFDFPVGGVFKTQAELKAKAEFLAAFTDGTLPEEDFKTAYAELEDLLFGYIPQERFDSAHDAFDQADTLNIPYWKQLCRETLFAHLYDKKRHPEGKGIPQVDVTGLGTLTASGQKLAWERLSVPARKLVELNPSQVIHAVIMKEDQRNLSPHAVLKGEQAAELYLYLQARVLYYEGGWIRHDDFHNTLRYFMLNEDEGKEMTKRLFDLHPEIKARRTERLQLIMRLDRNDPKRLFSDGSGKPRELAAEDLFVYKSDARGATEQFRIRELVNMFGKFDGDGPPTKRAKLTNEKKKTKPRIPVSMGIILMHSTSLVMQDLYADDPGNAHGSYYTSLLESKEAAAFENTGVGGSMFEKLQRDLQVSLELQRMEDMAETKAVSVFGPLPVRVRLLRYRQADTNYMVSLIKKADRRTCVPFENSNDNPLWLICCFIGDWLTRRGVVNPLQKQQAFPIKTPDEKAADHGPFHAILFDAQATMYDPMNTHNAWNNRTYRAEIQIPAPDYMDSREKSKPEQWLQSGKPTYPTVKEVVHALAGKPQDISTWFAYRALVKLRDLFRELDEVKEGSSEKERRVVIRHHLQFQFGTLTSPETMPLDCLLAIPEEDSANINFMLALVERNLNEWIGGQISENPPRDQVKFRLDVLQQFIDEKVAKADFDDAFTDLARILFGQLNGTWELSDGETVQLDDETKFWTGYCKSTLKFHLFTSRELYAAKATPQRTHETGTLDPMGAFSAYKLLSRPAQRLVEKGPDHILHAVIMGEDPDRLSPYAVLANADRYRLLQPRVVYWDNRAGADPWQEFGDMAEKPWGRKLAKQLLGMHPEVKLKQLLSFQMGADKEDEETGHTNVARKTVLANTDMRKFIYSFGGKQKARHA